MKQTEHFITSVGTLSLVICNIARYFTQFIPGNLTWAI